MDMEKNPQEDDNNVKSSSSSSPEIIAEEVSVDEQNVEEETPLEKKNNVKELEKVSVETPLEKKNDKDLKNVSEIEEMESINIHEDEEEEDEYRIEGEEEDSSSDSGDEEEEEEEEETTETKPDLTDSVVVTTTSSSAWTDKASAIKNFVRMRSEATVNSFMNRLSGKQLTEENGVKETMRLVQSPKAEGRSSSIWNPLSYLKMMQNDEQVEADTTMEESSAFEYVVMKGRIILYTRLGCEECRECRLYLHSKRLRYVEINIDIYPTRKKDISSDVPKVFFNEELVGGLKELKELEESGKLEEKVKYLVAEPPSREAPLPPFSGEDDASSKGSVDELALIVLTMKPCIVKDRFYKMRRFKSCFLGSEAVDFISADLHLAREEAVEVARKLASQLFFQNVLDENLFEDGNHLYRFLDDDPMVSSQCHNIPRGIIELKPRRVEEIAFRLRLLFLAILEAYTSVDGVHVDYRSIHGSEEFARYLRIIQELHRVEVEDMKREEKLAFFINLYNMMAIHAILVWGHPSGPLERTKMFNDFKYVIGGNTYSLSAIQNGILRGNHRPPYNLMKPFGAKDKRAKVALPYTEPLTHFALVCGTRSGPPLRCFSPGEIDEELMEAARDFLRRGGLRVDLNSKVAYISKIFNWYGVDFGKDEEEVLKHASTYLEPQLSEALLDLLVDTQFRVVYQSYDWRLNN